MPVKSRTKTIETLRRHIRASEEVGLKAQMRQAGLPDDDVRVAGAARPKEEDTGGPSGTMRRNIPKDYDYDPAAMKPLAQMLWALSICLGHAMTAHRQFTKLKSATISPDGLLGGRGYVMAVKDIRSTLHDACEAISAVSDTIHDELHAPHWRSKLLELEGEDVESVERLVGDAERVLENPEEESFVEDGINKAEEQGEQAELEEHEVDNPESDERFAKPEPPPEFTGEGDDEDEDDDEEDEEGAAEEEAGAEMPDGEDLADTRETVKTASTSDRLPERVLSRFASSEHPPGTPRTIHLDQGDLADGWGEEWGDDWTDDDWESDSNDWNSGDGLDWDDEPFDKFAESWTPGHYNDMTPTEGWDFGLGYGEGNDAHGQGPGAAGEIGPSSKLPSDPGGQTKDDTSDSNPAIEAQIGVSNRNAQAKLPNDGEPGVARSDYYRGAGSELPGEADALYDYSIDAQPGVGYRVERNQPYVKWDHTTHNMRPDILHQRNDEGPYVKRGKV
jgi:hypothetical protein